MRLKSIEIGNDNELLFDAWYFTPALTSKSKPLEQNILFSALVLGLYPNSWQGPLSTSLFWRWLGLSLALALHGLVCTRFRVLGLASMLLLSVVPHVWLEIRLAKRGKSLAPLWPVESTASDRGSTIEVEGRHRSDWGRIVPSSLRTARRSSRRRSSPVAENATFTTKGRRSSRRRANSVAFACQTTTVTTNEDALPLPIQTEQARRSSNVEAPTNEPKCTIFSLSWGIERFRTISSVILQFRRPYSSRKDNVSETNPRSITSFLFFSSVLTHSTFDEFLSFYSSFFFFLSTKNVKDST